MTGLLQVGCSSSSSSEGAAQPTGNVRSGDIRENDVWKNGLALTGTVRIIAPAVVEIEPGATIKCAPGVQILVGGTLHKGAGARSRIACDEWTGITAAQGGTVDLEAIDLVNPTVGIETTEGAGDVKLSDATVQSSVRPFLVGKQSTLTLTNVTMSVPAKVPDNTRSIGEVHGSLHASHVDYDAGSNEGISVVDGGDAVIEDSNLHGTGGKDMVSVYGGKTLEVRYSTLTGAHCGAHVQGVDSFTFDHVTSDKNLFGITIYAAGAGPNVVKDSNLTGSSAWLDLQGDHGPISFDGDYTSGGKPIIQNTDPPTLGPAASSPIADAKPR